MSPIRQIPDEGARPNIILVLCDDLGFGDIGVLFQNRRRANPALPALATPCLDRMAAEGLVMEGMYCPAPVCAPSRASLLTGTTQGHCELRDNHFDQALEDSANMASVLGAAGYATAAIGKWGLAGEPTEGSAVPDAWPAYPLRRGFDEFFGYIRHRDGHEHYPKEGIYRGRKEVWHNGQEVSADLDCCYTTDLFTAKAKQWMTDQVATNPDHPFFVYLAYDTPHAVTELPPCPFPSGGGVDGGLQWQGEAGRMINTAHGEPDSYLHPDYAHAVIERDGQTIPWPEVYRRYATAVRRIDDCVGDLLQTLHDLGIDDNTLVIFTSDNGPSIESFLPERLRADFFESYGPFDGIKRDCWEGGLRVGAIARHPGLIPAGRTSAAPTQFHDLLPTFADLAEVVPPARTDGVSLVPLLTGEVQASESSVYVEYAVNGRTPDYPGFGVGHRDRVRGQMQMLRLGDYVGVRYDIQDPHDPFEIHHIGEDPKQAVDLAPGRPDLQAELQASVARLRMPHPDIARPYDEVCAGSLDDAAAAGVAVERRSYTGSYPWIPLLDKEIPLESVVVDWPDDTTPIPADTTALWYHGEIEVPADGAYRFEVSSPHPVLLRIHRARVVERDPAANARPANGIIRLARGRHPFRLYVLGAQPAGLDWQPVTESVPATR